MIYVDKNSPEKNRSRRKRKKQAKKKMENNTVPRYRKQKKITKSNQLVKCTKCGNTVKRKDSVFVLHEKTHDRSILDIF